MPWAPVFICRPLLQIFQICMINWNWDNRLVDKHLPKMMLISKDILLCDIPNFPNHKLDSIFRLSGENFLDFLQIFCCSLIPHKSNLEFCAPLQKWHAKHSKEFFFHPFFCKEKPASKRSMILSRGNDGNLETIDQLWDHHQGRLKIPSYLEKWLARWEMVF